MSSQSVPILAGMVKVYESVTFGAEVGGNEPDCDPAQENSQQGDPSASVEPSAHQCAIFKVRRQRVLVGKCMIKLTV